MKKIIITILTLSLLLFTLTACGDNNNNQPPAQGNGDMDAFDLYLAMTDAVADLDSLQATVNANISMEFDGESIDMLMTMEVEQVMRSATDIELAMAMTTDMGEFGSMNINMYFRDGYLYQDMSEVLGVKMRSPLPIEDMLEGMGLDGAAILFERGDIRDSSVREVGANREFHFILDGDALSDILADMMGDMMDNLGVGDVDFSFGDVNYTVVIGPDYLPITEHLIFTMEMNLMGETVTASYDMMIGYLSFNSITYINFPADLDEYVDGELF